MNPPTELGSEKLTRWSKSIWPNLVGLFGTALITFDCILDPPPDATSAIGLACLGATGFVKLNRAEKRADDDQ